MPKKYIFKGGYEVFYEHILQKALKETQLRPKTL